MVTLNSNMANSIVSQILYLYFTTNRRRNCIFLFSALQCKKSDSFMFSEIEISLNGKKEIYYCKYWQFFSFWSFAEKTFVKQSMMLCCLKFCSKLDDLGVGVNRHCRFGVNHHCQFQGGKSYRRFGVTDTCRFEAKSSVRFTPPWNWQGWFTPNRQWRFTPTPKSYLPISCVKLEDRHCAKDPFTGRSISCYSLCLVIRTPGMSDFGNCTLHWSLWGIYLHDFPIGIILKIQG